GGGKPWAGGRKGRGGGTALTSGACTSGLRKFERGSPALARDHCRAQQELARTFLVRRNPAQVVEVALAHLRVARFEPLLVGDRLLLHELDGNGAALEVVK